MWFPRTSPGLARLNFCYNHTFRVATTRFNVDAMNKLALIFVSSIAAAGAQATNLNLAMVADDFFEAFISTSDSVQGTQFAQQTSTWQAGTTTGTTTLTAGVTNYLHIRARDVFGAPSMIVGELNLSDSGFYFDNNTQNLLTNAVDWKVSLTGFGSGYFTPTVVGQNGQNIWGTQTGISLNALRIWSNQTQGEHYFSVRINPVPEPATLTALGLGLAVAARRRKK